MKITPAISALLHTAESAGSSAILTLVVGLVQQISTQQVNWSSLITVFGSGFIAALGLIYKSVLASPDLAQAESDTTNQVATEAKSLAQQALGHIENIWPVLHNLTTQQAAQKTAQSVVAPAIAGRTYQVTDMPLSTAGGVYNTSYIPTTPNNTATVGMVLPQRSFTESALMPAVSVPK